MNYLQEHYGELSNLGKGILVCYHDNMVEIQELDNLSSDSAPVQSPALSFIPDQRI